MLGNQKILIVWILYTRYVILVSWKRSNMKIWMLLQKWLHPIVQCTIFFSFFSKYGMYSEHGFLFLDIRSRRTPAKTNWIFWNCIEYSKKVTQCMFRCENYTLIIKSLLFTHFIEFIRWFHELSVTMNLWIFQEIELVYLFLCSTYC